MSEAQPILTDKSQKILEDLRELRRLDAPTHGGKALSYV